MAHELMKTPQRSLSRRALGSPLLWARDLGWTGMVTAVAAPLAIFPLVQVVAGSLTGAVDFVVVNGVIGGFTGMMIGLCAPFLLEYLRGWSPVWILWPMGVALGASWGGLTGLLAGAFIGGPALVLGPLCGMMVGAIQLSWLFVPCVVASAMQLRTWPLLLTATLTSPALGLILMTPFLVL